MSGDEPLYSDGDLPSSSSNTYLQLTVQRLWNANKGPSRRTLGMSLFFLTTFTTFPILQRGDRLGCFSIQNWGAYTLSQPMGLPYRFQAGDTPLGILNQTLVPEIPNLYVLGFSHSNSSFHCRIWSPRNSLQTRPRCPWMSLARNGPQGEHFWLPILAWSRLDLELEVKVHSYFGALARPEEVHTECSPGTYWSWNKLRYPTFSSFAFALQSGTIYSFR